MTTTPSILGAISREQFLAEYWQKKPLLVRNAIANFEPPIDANELAGMALEEEVESRIVIEQDWQFFEALLAHFRVAHASCALKLFVRSLHPFINSNSHC